MYNNMNQPIKRYPSYQQNIPLFPNNGVMPNQQLVNAQAVPKPIPDNYDHLPSQRGRYLSEQRYSTPSNWGSESANQQKVVFAAAASAANLETLYNENSRFGEKVPFLGSFFDRQALRNEFEHFILLKLLGNKPGEGPNTSIPSYLTEHAKKTIQKDSDESKENQKPPQTNDSSRRREDNAGNANPSRRKEKMQKKFFDKADDNNANNRNDDEQRGVSSRDRQTFGDDTAAPARRHYNDNRFNGRRNDYRSREDGQRRGGRFRGGRGRGRGRGYQSGGGYQSAGRNNQQEEENYFAQQQAEAPKPAESESAGENASQPEENAWGKEEKSAISFGDDEKEQGGKKSESEKKEESCGDVEFE